MTSRITYGSLIPACRRAAYDKRRKQMLDRLLTEIQRQEKYLSRLPENYTFPLFNAKTALESQRRNGYRNTASAAREIVDNAIEAGAKKVHIVFETARQKGKGGKTTQVVSGVAFIDNGSGMVRKMARYALSWALLR